MKKLVSFLTVIIFTLSFTACTFSFDGNQQDLYNKANTETVKSCVKIVAENRKTLFDVHYSIGSGVIYQFENGYCYALTNYHVVKPVSSGYQVIYCVYDCYGNKCQASLQKYSEEDDLSIIKFKLDTTLDIKALQFANNSCKIGNAVVAIGSPSGIFNAVTVGKVTDIRNVTLTDESQNTVTYPVVCHNALIANGSSGGALLNSNLEIVGINYAGGINENDEFAEGYAIPLLKVVAFVNGL